MTFWEHDDGIRSTTRRARVVEVDDKKSQQRLKLRGLKNEAPEEIWRPQPFGYSSNPPKDSDGVMIQMGSRSDRTLYLDGGHEKYRPKNTPVGGTVLFNHSGDIIRVFKDNLDIVHAKKISHRIGHGYKSGDSGNNSGEGEGEAGNTQPDDEKAKDTKTISIVQDGDKIVITYQNAKVTWSEASLLLEKGGSTTLMQDSKITVTSQHVVIVSDRVDLGDEGGILVKRCDDSCATKVYAI